MASLNLLMVLFCMFYKVIGQVTPVCTPSSNPSDPQLPQLPDQFSFSIEAVLVERNVSVYATEHYDGLGNRAQMNFAGPRGKVNSILDYNLREAFVFPNIRTGDDCTVSILNPNTTNREVQFIFGIEPGPNNTVHIGSPSLFFNLANVSNAKYIGIELTQARGVPTYHWQTCTNSENTSYSIDYYFTNGNLTRTSADGYIPVLIVLNSSRINMTTGEEYSVLHYYSFFNFLTGPDSVPDDIFQIPLDLVCKGRLPGQPLPVFPNVFSTNIEVVSSRGIQTFEEYYDYVHQLLRIDGYLNLPRPFGAYSSGIFSIVHDFSIGAQYFLKPDENRCLISSLNSNNTFYDGTMDSNGHLRLDNLRNLFLANSQFQFVYEGVSTVRGIPVDVWLSYRGQERIQNNNFYNVTYIIYISRPGQIVSSEFGLTTTPVIVQTSFKAVLQVNFSNGTTTMRNISSITGLMGFTPSEPPLDAFATLNCLSIADYQQIKFRIPLTSGPTTQNNFRSNIRSAFLDYATKIGMPFLSPLQINNIKIDTNSIPGAALVSLYITNIPANASVTWQYSVQSIVSAMTAGLTNNSRLPFTLRFNGSAGGDEVYPLHIITEVTETDCSGRASVPIVIGISFGVLILGIAIGLILGFVFCFCYQRYKTTGSFNPFHHSSELPSKYERQVDDVNLQ